MEGVRGGVNVDRFVVMGTEPYKVIRTGPEEDQVTGDPLVALQEEIEKTRMVNTGNLPSALPLADCGAIGYVSYDCVRYFEPRVDEFIEKQKNVMKLPESSWMFFNSLVAVDNLEKDILIISLCRLDGDSLKRSYELAVARLDQLEARIMNSSITIPEPIDSSDTGKNIAGLSTPLKPLKSTFTERGEPISNVGQEGYKNMVSELKTHIKGGDIIQAVPSQRLAV